MLKDRIFNNRFLIRSIEAEDLIEIFLVSAIAAVLVIRLYLNITGYPTLGGELIHFAHMLWGGFFMLGAILILITLLSRSAKKFAAVIGGIGFGTFIDELGKFITHDNNYFFQPTAAIIYLIFIILFLFSQKVNKVRNFSKKEHLINALEIFKEAAHNDLEGHEKKQALDLLKNLDKKDPIVRKFASLLNSAESIPRKKPGLVSKTHKILHKMYEGLISKKWFSLAVITFFIIYTIGSLWSATSLFQGLRSGIGFGLLTLFITAKTINNNLETKKRIIYGGLIFGLSLLAVNAFLNLKIPSLSLAAWGELISSSIAGIFIIAGLWKIRKNRLRAYELFKKAVLISIFLTQFFAFYKEQFSAVIGLAWNILILITLRYMINEEAELKEKNGKRDSS